MSITQLNLSGAYTPPASGVVNLRFGTAAATPVNPVSCALIMAVPPPVWIGTARYVNNVSRLLSTATPLGWQQAAPQAATPGMGWEQTTQHRTHTRLRWQSGRALPVGLATGFGATINARPSTTIIWDVADPSVGHALRAAHHVLTLIHPTKAVPWQWARGVGRKTAAGFAQMIPIKPARVLAWHTTAQRIIVHTLYHNMGRGWTLGWWLPWEQGRRPPTGRRPTARVIIPVPGHVPGYNLDFRCGATAPPWHRIVLRFDQHPCAKNIDAKKVYFILNNIQLKRVVDDEPIEILSASVGIDHNSWAWSFTGSIPYTDLAKVEPTSSGPVAVELTINNIAWRFLIESYDEQKTFAKTNITLHGRSLSAWLHSPYAPTRSFIQTTALSSRQFAEAELTRPGLITGFDLDWLFPDELGWDMPAETWSYNNLPPLEVISQIVQGAGGYVNSHRQDQTLIVRPTYPTPFWEWDRETPDRVLPKTLIRSQNLRWAEKPLYNGVFVSGENTGVTARVRRAGTLGDFLAPAFTGAMISSALAARMKGLSLLSSGGKQATVGLELPLEASVGLLTPGMLIEVTNGGYGMDAAWRGLIRSTNIEARRGSHALTVSQSVEIERHYGG